MVFRHLIGFLVAPNGFAAGNSYGICICDTYASVPVKNGLNYCWCGCYEFFCEFFRVDNCRLLLPTEIVMVLK